MPWCPKCRVEYDAGVSACYDCGCGLVDELGPSPEESLTREAFLMRVSNENEFLVVASKLTQYGIPTVKRYRDAGDVTLIYMGRSFALDVFVPESAVTEAREIMKINAKTQDNGCLPSDVDAKKKSPILTILLIIFVGWLMLRFLRIC